MESAANFKNYRRISTNNFCEYRRKLVPAQPRCPLSPTLPPTPYRHLEEAEGMSYGIPLISRGAEERLAPILMTAMTTALALLPIAIGGSKPDYEIEHPMAVVIIGGLAASTVLNLFVMPALYRLPGKR